jgi:hypothetical protein
MSLNLTEGINVMKNSHSYNFQEIVTMSCTVGFTETTITSQCTDVNTWSQKTPICTNKILYIHQTIGLGNEAPPLISSAFLDMQNTDVIELFEMLHYILKFYY